MSLHYGHSNPSMVDQREVKHAFDINMTRAYNNPDTLSHKVGINDNRAMIIRDGDSWLHQDDYSKCPSLIRKRDGECFITSESNTSSRKRFIFNSPELTGVNVSVFIVVKSSSAQRTGKWGYIVGNDNGGYDKFIGHTTGSGDELSYGGGSPVKEYKCTIPTGIDVTEKHLISCHWLMTGSHLRVNNVECAGSKFAANPRDIGAPFGSLFYNERFIDNVNYKPFIGEIYGIRIVKRFLRPEDINEINNNMMLEYNV